ncbi:MAG: hypothetical protein NVSMB51_01240 [Solirubrobacteraceae bacterium]
MLAVSMLLIVTGSVLRYAVETSVPGISLQKVGTILIVTGGVALALALTLHYTDTNCGHVAAHMEESWSRPA